MTIPVTPPWGASPQTVRVNFGENVTDEVVKSAGSIIETYGGLVGVDLSRWPQNKLAWLKRAVELQAIYQTDNPDIYSLAIYRRLEADGVTQTFFNDDNTISPAARKCLLRLSGKYKIRTLKMRGASGITVPRSMFSEGEDTGEILGDDDDDQYQLYEEIEG